MVQVSPETTGREDGDEEVNCVSSVRESCESSQHKGTQNQEVWRCGPDDRFEALV